MRRSPLLLCLALAACGGETADANCVTAATCGGADAATDVGDDVAADVPNDTDAAVDVEVDTGPPPRPYPEPGDWPANRGPGGPAVSFDEAELYEACITLDGGPTDYTDHHNLVTMYDGYLLMPWAPEYGQGGLTMWDISDPCAPQVAGSGTSPSMRETHAIGFSPIGGRWAVVNHMEHLFSGGIEFWDVSDPATLAPVATLALPGYLYPDAYARVTLSVFWQAPYVYVTGSDNGVYIVDATDPMNPVHVGTWQTDPILRAGQVQAVGDLLVVTAAEGPRTVLLDISDPANPQPIPGGDFEATDADGEPRDAYFTTTSGGYIYYARKEGGGGLIVWDIHDPTQPTYAGQIDSNGNGGYVFLHEGYAFVGESNFAAIYDVRDLSAITEVTRLDLEGDLDTASPIGNVVVLSVDDEAVTDEGSSVVPWQTEPDTRGPQVSWVWPADGANDLATTSRIGITFDENVDVASAWEGSVRLYRADEAPELGRVDGWISAQETIVTFWPQEPLEPDTEYVLEIPAGGVADFNGNAITEPFTATFRTAP